MFTKEEKRNFNKEFWTCFGVFMKKHNQKYGRVKWANYNSNVKDVYFRLSMDTSKAEFAIEVQHKDDGIRELFYQQFLELKKLIDTNIGDGLNWEELSFNSYGSPISKISVVLENKSIYNKDDWTSVFHFFEKRMAGLHDFWLEFNEVFKDLEG